MFRRAITACAAFFALAAVVQAADPTTPAFIPPWAGTDIPVILSLAKHSACKDAARMISAGRSESAIRVNLQRAIGRGLFPWRFEVTNGYQEGFFCYALLGYASEQSGDIPFAYRCYQNALLCINEEKTFSCQEPTAEIYLGLGRTCLAAGRYMDAKDWLDTAYLEAGDNTNIQAAVDRVLIQRGNELGDYPDIIFLYQHLESLSPPSKRDPGGYLTKSDYANYAQVLFSMHQDRSGFSKLLEGICKLGIDNDLGFKDPLVDVFFRRILRADDDEVSQFYDHLRWAIADARALKGDEDFLVLLLEARKMMCRAYDFLQPEEDLAIVRQRIEQVKKELAATPRGSPARKREARGKPSTLVRPNGTVARRVRRTPESAAEDALMHAELLYLGGKTNEALKECSKLLKTTKNTTVRRHPYDGTTWENAARMLVVMSFLDLKGTTQWSNVSFDGSLRAQACRARLMASGLMDCGEDQPLPALPYYHPALVSVLVRRAEDMCKKSDDAAAIRALEDTLRERTWLFKLYPLLVERYVRMGNVEAGYKAATDRITEDLYAVVAWPHFWVFWRVFADLSDARFRELRTLDKRRDILRCCGRKRTWRHNRYGPFVIEEKIRFGSEKERKFESSKALNTSAHPRYAERCISNSGQWGRDLTNFFAAKMLTDLPSMVRDYPPERIRPLIKFTRECFKNCSMTRLRLELPIVQSSPRHIILSPPIMVLPVKSVAKSPEFLDKLEQYLNERKQK